MKRADRNKAYDVAIKTTNECYQVGMAIEEMSELMKELVKKSVRGKDNIPEIAEEIADVMVTIEGLIRLYSIPDSVISGIMDKKIRYMLKKMEKINKGESVVYSSHDYIENEKNNVKIQKPLFPDMNISVLNLDVRVVNALHRKGINNIGDLVKYNRIQISEFQGIGKKGLSEIISKLKEYSISL